MTEIFQSGKQICFLDSGTSKNFRRLGSTVKLHKECGLLKFPKKHRDNSSSKSHKNQEKHPRTSFYRSQSCFIEAQTTANGEDNDKKRIGLTKVVRHTAPCVLPEFVKCCAINSCFA